MLLDNLRPSTKEIKGDDDKTDYMAAPLVFFYDANQLLDNPLALEFWWVLRPVEEFVPQGNVRWWAWVLHRIRTGNDDTLRHHLRTWGVTDSPAGRNVMDNLGMALCDRRLLEMFDGQRLPPWTRAVAALTLLVVSERVKQAPKSDAVLRTYGFDESTNYRKELHAALHELQAEYRTGERPAGPQAFYWLARAAADLDRLEPGQARTHVWQIYEQDQPLPNAPPPALDKADPKLERYFQVLAAALANTPASISADEGDPCLVYLQQRIEFRPADTPATIPGQVLLTRWERVKNLFGGRPDRVTPTGWLSAAAVAGVIVLLAFGLALWRSSSPATQSFHAQQEELTKQLDMD